MLIRFFIRLCIPDWENVENKTVRTRYGVFGGWLGIVCNLILFLIKIVIGFISSSIAVISDAFNNMSDIGTSVVALIGAKLSNQRPDPEHPFGHGRIEYISSLIVSFIIMTVGLELLKTSVGKIFSPVTPTVSIPTMLILSVSVLIKIWMFFSMRYLGKRIHSDVLSATAYDSLSDAIATSLVIATVWLSPYLPPVADGIAGMIVALLICFTSVKIAWKTINTLIGSSPDPALAQQLSEIILSDDEILGIHDLIIHDYGPGRKLASVHAEVSSAKSSIYLHEIIDAMEVRVLKETGVETVLHTDPILIGCEKTDATREIVKSVIARVNPEFGMHDFRMTDGENRINLIFDLEVPFSVTEADGRIAIKEIRKLLAEENPKYVAVIRVDYKPLYKKERS